MEKRTEGGQDYIPLYTVEIAQSKVPFYLVDLIL